MRCLEVMKTVTVNEKVDESATCINEINEFDGVSCPGIAAVNCEAGIVRTEEAEVPLPPRGSLVYNCSTCLKQCFDFAAFKRHMSDFHPLLLKCFQCKICKKQFYNKKSLNEHESSHGQNEKMCEICGQFITKDLLTAHSLSHAADAHRCEVCDERFASEGALEEHEVSHKPFKCPECELRFAFDYQVELHRLRHKRLDEYVCSVCSEVFTGRRTFLKHERKGHEPPEQQPRKKPKRRWMPWDCKLCDAYFRKRQQLLRHIRENHPEGHDDASGIKAEQKLIKSENSEDSASDATN